MSNLVGIGEIARVAKLHPNTIRKLANSGAIPSVRTQGGQRRFNITLVQSALASRNSTRIAGSTDIAQSIIPEKKWEREFPLAGLSEDLVWKELSQELKIDLSNPAADIFPYAFTEMLNNAIEHSNGSTVHVTFLETVESWEFQIADNGKGAFQKIMDTFGLLTPLEAIAELSKGKRTTAPKNHTGEGIFFTSKAVDVFELTANGYTWMQNNLINDFAVEESSIKIGTKVLCRIQIDTSRKLISIFQQFSSDHNFDRSKPVIKLFETGMTFLSRSEARRLSVGLEKFTEVYLDFSKVRSVGQGFVDEIFRVWAAQHPEITLIPIKMNPAVEFMVERGIQKM